MSCPSQPITPPVLPVEQLLDFYMANLMSDKNVSRFKCEYPGLTSAFFSRDLQGGSVEITKADGTKYKQTGDFIRQSASINDAGDGTIAINTRMAKQIKDAQGNWIPSPIYVAMMRNQSYKITTGGPVLGNAYSALYYKPYVVDWVQPDGSLDSSKPVVREVVGIGIIATQ
jgi:hypothetical protein